MMLTMDTRVEEGRQIAATLTIDTGKLTDPVICFSMMAPVRAMSGCWKCEGLGGFTALQLEGELTPAAPLRFSFGFEDPGFVIGNRAWYPQGSYLRRDDGGFQVIALTVERGVRLDKPPVSRMPASGLALAPAPLSWEPGQGSLFCSSLDITGDWPDAVAAVHSLRKRLQVSDKQSEYCLGVEIVKDEDLPPEGYQLRIEDTARLAASTATGAFYGLVTLTTLQVTHAGWIPKGTITDSPRFEWRGFMLDCVRCFYPVDAICKLLDLMALLKLNRFHWHFADDEAFRLQVEIAPDLWQGSAFRGEGEALPGLFGAGAGPTGGSYSKADVERIVAHAAALQIEVLPEIEVPAHALALTTLRPDLRDPDDTGTEASVQGYQRNAVNPALAATWDLLEPLAREVAALFPFDHIHLGGDELPPGTWDGSPAVAALKARLGLVTSQDVQGYVMRRLAGHLAQIGVTSCAWQEAGDGSQGGIGNDAILFSWTGEGPGRAAAEQGYRVVMCPAQHCYFDMAHSADPDDWGANWAATFALDQAFQWEPVPEGLSPAAAARIIGVEGTFWSEFTDTAREYEPMIAPRILGLATRAWSPAVFQDLEDMRAIASCYSPFFALLDWRVYGPAIDMTTPSDSVNRVDA